MINATKASLEELLETNSPVQKFLAVLESYTNICEDIKVSAAQQQQLYCLQEKYITSLVANVEARFASSSPVLAALKIFDPLAVPETTELGFSVYGNMDIATLAEHFYQADNDTSRRTEEANYLQSGTRWNSTSTRTSSLTFPLKSRQEKATPTALSGSWATWWNQSQSINRSLESSSS